MALDHYERYETAVLSRSSVSAPGLCTLPLPRLGLMTCLAWTAGRGGTTTRFEISGSAAVSPSGPVKGLPEPRRRGRPVFPPESAGLESSLASRPLIVDRSWSRLPGFVMYACAPVFIPRSTSLANARAEYRISGARGLAELISAASGKFEPNGRQSPTM